MRHAISTLSLVLLVAGPVACAADADPVERSASSENALAPIHQKTTHYVGSFIANATSYSVELDVTLPVSRVGFQQSDSVKWHSDSSHCRTFNDFTAGSSTLRVRGPGGNVVIENTRTTGTNGVASLDSAECPNGVLVSPSVEPVLSSTVDTDGVEFQAAGKDVHVPAGYFTPGSVNVDATSTFRAFGTPTFEQTQTDFKSNSVFKVNGVVSVALASETHLSIGIGPKLGAPRGYESIVEVTLRSSP